MKTLILIRGLPGSGKSTLAKMLAPAKIDRHEADDYFMEQGEYRFDPSKLKSAHLSCQAHVAARLQSGASPVVVSNTFSEKWEMAPYLEMANDAGYSVQVVECQSNFGSIHNVPEATIKAMRKRWQH